MRCDFPRQERRRRTYASASMQNDIVTHDRVSDAKQNGIVVPRVECEWNQFYDE